MLFFAFAWALASAPSLASAQLRDCYGINGVTYANNTLCPGSNTCCGFGATCLSNRLCHNPGDGDSTFIRGPCALAEYDEGTCAQICLYEEVDGVFPRVTVCEDGSLCCNNDSQCCSRGDGIFLDNNGRVANSAPSTTFSFGPDRTESGYDTETIVNFETTTSTTSTPATTTSSTLSETTTSAGMPTPTGTGDASADGNNDGSGEDDSGEDDNSLAIGLGVGISLGVVLIAAAVGWFFWRRRKAARMNPPQHQPTNQVHEVGGFEYGGAPKYGGPRPMPAEVESPPHVPVELDSGRHSHGRYTNELPA